MHDKSSADFRVARDRREMCDCLAGTSFFLVAGCGFAPSVNVLGSFFPAWLICIVVGVVLTILTRQVFVAMRIASDLGPAGLVYPCLAGLWIFATWLLLFGS
jgi:YtcA-like protein